MSDNDTLPSQCTNNRRKLQEYYQVGEKKKLESKNFQTDNFKN